MDREPTAEELIASHIAILPPAPIVVRTLAGNRRAPIGRHPVASPGSEVIGRRLANIRGAKNLPKTNRVATIRVATIRGGTIPVGTIRVATIHVVTEIGPENILVRNRRTGTPRTARSPRTGRRRTANTRMGSRVVPTTIPNRIPNPNRSRVDRASRDPVRNPRLRRPPAAAAGGRRCGSQPSNCPSARRPRIRGNLTSSTSQARRCLADRPVFRRLCPSP